MDFVFLRNSGPPHLLHICLLTVGEIPRLGFFRKAQIATLQVEATGKKNALGLDVHAHEVL